MSTNLDTAEGEIGFRSPLKIRPIPGRPDGLNDREAKKPKYLEVMPVAQCFKIRHGDSGVPGQILKGFQQEYNP